MSDSDFESDNWKYKPLKRTKRQDSTKSQNVPQLGAKRRKVGKSRGRARKTSENVAERQSCKTSTQAVQNSDTVNTRLNSGLKRSTEAVEPSLASVSAVNVGDIGTSEVVREESLSGSEEYCPVCQMPFSILVVQSKRWHVAECLDLATENQKECPDGVRCSSFIPSHYQRYSHSLLAQCRSASNSDSSSFTHITMETSDSSGLSPEHERVYSRDPTVETSVDSAVNVCSGASHSASSANGLNGTSIPTHTNALLLLRSPDPADIKKKKGWSPSSKSQSASQDTKTKTSTPLKPDHLNIAVDTGGIHEESSQAVTGDDGGMDCFHLSDFPTDAEVIGTKTQSPLFHSTARMTGEGNVDLPLMWSDHTAFSDDLLSHFTDQSDNRKCNLLVKNPEDMCVKSEPSSASPDHLISRSSDVADWLNQPRSAVTEGLCAVRSDEHSCHPLLPSPESLVLERLREQISNPRVDGLDSTCGECSPTNVKLPAHRSLNQTFTRQPPASMAPRKTPSKTRHAVLKQTDIGVFFGLKPLMEAEAGGEGSVSVSPSAPQKSPGPQEGNTKSWLRKRRRDPAVCDMATVGITATDGNAEPTQTEARGGGRRRWNRRGVTDGEAEQPKSCPFYKKIPGTPFAVDAFRYGPVEGIKAYFLTHFHSDHYGGLRRDSTFPIYCNKITGNLVKTKLKVDEQYVHVLPMNTECVVEGVKVVLLDANHCPGAAMLLFVLPDGQTVLHTGDFRADPAMEGYPELLRVRVQTLYLDTTYCNPEYCFPTQQEVITFAVNRAFEQVTLCPRTLVVCGTYSVGKEKVFLAVSEVLGSKVYLSREKYNTMRCLESEQICQRITTNMKAAQVHVLPMMQLNFRSLQAHLNKLMDKYDRVLAFKPTGWTFAQATAVSDIQPQVQGNITIYGVPYSEHSSFVELQRFVQWLRPVKIIPTVNVGSWSSRTAMQRCFTQWLAERPT